MRLETLLTLTGIIFASTGFWTFINSVWQEKSKKQSNESKLLLGLAYDRIVTLSSFYIKRGNITADEYHDLHHYLYVPYKAMGGNGTAERLMNEVSNLSLKKE